MGWLPTALQIGGMLVAITVAFTTLKGRIDTIDERDNVQQRAIDGLYQWRDAARLDGLAERLESANRRAIDAKVLADKLLDRQLDGCQQGEP